MDKRKKRVVQATMSGYILNIFESASEASKITNISASYISKICRGEKVCTGSRCSTKYKWWYE